MIINTEKHLVIGASGQVGEKILNLTSNKSKPSHKLNILNRIDTFKSIQSFVPTVVWLCAADTNVDALEVAHDPENGFVNIDGVRNVIDACSCFSYKPTIVFYSTDYIFDGYSNILHDGEFQLTSGPGPYTETSEPNTLSVYGSQKLEGEEMLKKYNRSLIIRTTWVYGNETQGKNFAMRLVKSLSEGKTVSIPDDEFSTPTYSNDLANFSYKYYNQHSAFYEEGCDILNIAGTKCISKYQWALDIADLFNLDKALITPVKSEELKRAAERPLLSGLDITKLHDKFKTISSYEDNLKAFKAEYDSNLVKSIIE